MRIYCFSLKIEMINGMLCLFSVFANKKCSTMLLIFFLHTSVRVSSAFDFIILFFNSYEAAVYSTQIVKGVYILIRTIFTFSRDILFLLPEDQYLAVFSFLVFFSST